MLGNGDECCWLACSGDTCAIVMIIVLGIYNDLYDIAVLYVTFVNGHFVAQQFATIEPALTTRIDAFYSLWKRNL